MSKLLVCCRSRGAVIPQALVNPIQRSRSPGDSHYRPHRRYATSIKNLPRVAQPSLWHSLIPKAFRESKSSRAPAKHQVSKDWNPATFFICIFLLIGSNAIQMLTLKNEYSSFSRKADSKIALLKEVLDKVQRGEKVDVGKVLGTGDKEQEHEWQDVISNIEEDDRLWASKDRRREKRRLKKEQEAATNLPKKEVAETTGDADTESPRSLSGEPRKPPAFY